MYIYTVYKARSVNSLNKILDMPCIFCWFECCWSYACNHQTLDVKNSTKYFCQEPTPSPSTSWMFLLCKIMIRMSCRTLKSQDKGPEKEWEADRPTQSPVHHRQHTDLCLSNHLVPYSLSLPTRQFCLPIYIWFFLICP